MASVQTSSYGGRYIKLTVTETGTSIANNTSTVQWKIESIGGTYNYYTIHNCKVVVNGTTVYNPGTVTASSQKFPASKGSKTGTITVKHNANGTASPISFALHGKVYTSGDENKTGTLSLSTIPRGFTNKPTLSCTSKTETSITLKWTTSETCSKVILHHQGSNITIYNNSTGAKTGTYTVSNLYSWTDYAFSITATKKDSGLTSDSNMYTYSTYRYPYITNITPENCSIGTRVTLSIYNPLGRTYNLRAIGGNDNGDTVYYASTSSVSTSYELTIPSNILYSNNTLSQYIPIWFILNYNNNDFEYINNPIIYNVTGNETPVFTDYNYYDNNSNVVNITEDNQVIIKGLSDICVSIPTNKAMSPQNYATAKNYVANIGNLTGTIPYNANGSSMVLGTLTQAGNLKMDVTAYDSRNLSKTVSKTITVYDYNAPVVNFEGHRVNNFENNVLLNLTGTYNTLNINGSNKNYITMIRRRHKESTSDTWSSWSTMNHDYPNGTFSRTNYALTFDNTKAWDIEIEVSDRFTTVSKTVHIDIGVPIFFISSNTKQCYKNGEILPNFDEIYPIGSIYLTVNNTFNPNNVFTGTWELVSQGKTLVGVDANDIDFNASQKTGGSKTHTLSTNEMPSHTHTFSGNAHNHKPSNTSYKFIISQQNIALNGTARAWWSNNGTADKHFVYSTETGDIQEATNTESITATGTNANTGGGQAHNNMPPYFTCYIWCRTA